MPMMIPPGEAVTVAVTPGQAAAPGPTPHPAPQPAPQPVVRSPFKPEVPPDLVIMPHLDHPPAAQPPG